MSVCASQTALAQDVTVLDRLVVKGDWLGEATKEEAKVYPGSRSVLTDEEIHETGDRMLEDVLRRAPGVRVEDETGTGILPNIGIRGLNPLRSERVMVLQDGMPLALAPYTGTGLSLFPTTLESIDRIDVVRGGVAVHHGPNNVGGVINLISRPITQEFSTTLKEKLTVSENGHTLTDTYARVSGFLTPDFGMQAQINVLRGESFREHSETDVTNLILDTDWLLDNGGELKGRLQYYKVDAELPGALTPAAYEEDRTQSQRPYDTFKADTWRGSLTYNQLIGDGEFKWLNYAYVADREFTFGEPFDPDATTTSVGLSPRDFFVAATEPRYTWQFETGDVTHNFTIGGRYVREEVDFIVDRRMLDTGAVTRQRDWRFETNALAGYVSDTLGFFEDRLNITPGLRYEYVDTDFADRLNGTDNNNLSHAPLPGLTIGYEATDSLYLFANANRSLRVPQVAQVTRSATVGSELAWNYEVGARFSPTPSLELGGTLFRIDFSDQIEFDRPSLTFQNLGKTRHQGVELEARWQPDFAPGLSLGASYAFLDTEQLSGQFEGNEVPFASEHQLSLTAGYEVGTWNFALAGYYQSAAFSDAANTIAESANGAVGIIPSHWLWNAQVTKEVGNLKLAFAVNNIFDEDHYFRGVDVSPIGRVPGPGRSFLLSVKADF
jgi:Fe(3+) dicitrate transport protein